MKSYNWKIFESMLDVLLVAELFQELNWSINDLMYVFLSAIALVRRSRMGS